MKKKLCPKCNPILIDIVCTIFLLLGLIICIINAFEYTKKEEIIYKETSKVNYKVYLKDNNFYETPYLEDGMAYVATLIDKIHINYDYLLTSSTNTNLDIDYKIIAKLIIGSQNNSKVFFESPFILFFPFLLSGQICPSSCFKFLFLGSFLLFLPLFLIPDFNIDIFIVIKAAIVS